MSRILNGLLLLCLALQIACGESKREDGALSGESSVDEKLRLRAEEIHASVYALLEKKFPEENGVSWSASRMDVDDDFLVESPEGLWGLNADQLPKDLDCNKNSAGCDADFLRVSCESDADCMNVGTHCAPLAATVKVLDQEPKKLCLGPSDRLIDRFYNVMVAAEKELDIVSLSMPDGRFRTAMNHALAVLSQKANPPSVRLLFSGFNSGLPNILNPPQKIMDQIMRDVRKLSPSADTLRMNLAWLADGRLSWNHAKIIVADGNRALVGGHNMWDKDYLRPNPIFDLSLEYRGEAAEKSRDFTNALWTKIGDRIGTSGPDVERLEAHEMKAESQGGGTSINVGRMGSYGANPSDDAIIGMIDAAKTSLMIDQQDYFNVIVTNTALTRSFAFDAIIKAAMRGVAVQLIQSNKYPLGNYGMIEPKKAYENFINELSKRLEREKQMSKADAKKMACDRIVYAPFRINSRLNEWPHGRGSFGSHSKWVMVDEAAIYVGSHNLYPANLQEYGNILTDIETVGKLKKAYWDKVWKESSAVKLACP